MTYLYVLCEGLRDDAFYESLCERITGQTFERPSNYQLRPGENWKTAMEKARLLISGIRHWKGNQDAAVVIAIDNDRAPGHPSADPLPRPLAGVDRKKRPRHQELTKMLESALGEDRSKWPIDVALAIPVEMIESWLLILHDPNLIDLPIFSDAKQQLARLYYGSNPPPQLKKLRDTNAESLGSSLDDYFFAAANRDLDAAAASSRSFAMFQDEVRTWRCSRSPQPPA